MVVGSAAKTSSRWWTWSALGIAMLVVSTSFVIGWRWLASSHMPQSSKSQSQAAEQTKLNAASTSGSDSEIVATSTQLIHDNTVARARGNSKTLAMDYLDRGTAYTNLHQYTQAVGDFKQAAKLDDSLKEAALQGEASALYRMGDRQQVLTVLQQLEQLAPSSHDSMDTSAAAYQYDIQAIQQGKAVSL